MFEPLHFTSCGPQLSTVSAFQRPSWMRGACPGFGWVTVTGVLKLLPRTLLALPLSFGVHRDFLTFCVSQVKWNIKKKKKVDSILRDIFTCFAVRLSQIISFPYCPRQRLRLTWVVEKTKGCILWPGWPDVKLWPESLDCISMSWKYVSLLGGVLQNLTYGVVFHLSMNWGSRLFLKLAALERTLIVLDKGIFIFLAYLGKPTCLKAAEFHVPWSRLDHAKKSKQTERFSFFGKYLLKSLSLFAGFCCRGNTTYTQKPKSPNHNAKLLRNILLFEMDHWYSMTWMHNSF